MSFRDLEEAGLEKVQTWLFGVQNSAWVRGEFLISHHSAELRLASSFCLVSCPGTPFMAAATFWNVLTTGWCLSGETTRLLKVQTQHFVVSYKSTLCETLVSPLLSVERLAHKLEGGLIYQQLWLMMPVIWAQSIHKSWLSFSLFHPGCCSCLRNHNVQQQNIKALGFLLIASGFLALQATWFTGIAISLRCKASLSSVLHHKG